ncbi:EAL domain-containing protein [uncultured Anaeromusa sp.]|uniref:EAL domain-containing protein n=1 Tax=uncultured Anaeromusa sp. TaxID=673273 RepID=UPI0029C756DD|nr:EAL domain-containing protein [uncultured Anaeromusa sp.]
MLISSMEESIEKLNRLKAMGVSISLDDFGTGFSSLTYLQRLPVQTLKLDRSFIDGLLKSATHRSLIACIIEMAHVLGMQVVAEGVETLEQRNWLRECGCDFMQGYLISPSVPLQEAQAML